MEVTYRPVSVCRMKNTSLILKLVTGRDKRLNSRPGRFTPKYIAPLKP